MSKLKQHHYRHWIILLIFFIASNFLVGEINKPYNVQKVEAADEPLLQQNNLTYLGAFKVPSAIDQIHTYEYGGTALTYWPAHNSLLMVGHDYYQQVGEFSIPTPSTASSISALPRATIIQTLTDVLAGKLNTVDGGTYNGVKIGGIIPLANSLIISAWDYYDTAFPSQSLSHFVTGQNFSSITSADVKGPFQVGTGYILDGTPAVAGFVSGYMSTIPPEWQAALGGTHLTGQGGDISVLGRTSSGPSATVFTPTDLGVTVPAPGIKVMGYPLNHPTLGQWGVEGGLYDGSQGFRGMVFPNGTGSILFIGWGGRFCYGAGTADPALDLQPLPNDPEVHYCYDLSPGGTNNKGTHSYPTTPIIWAYDVNDFIAVKNGTKNPWDIRPYATWTFTLPFQSNIVDGNETGSFGISGAAYDPSTQRIFLSTTLGEGAQPIIHVFQINNVTPPPPPPPPSPTTLVGDLNGDKIVNSLDWSLMNSKWFTTDTTADLNHDGLVNAIDFSLLNANWFKTTN